MFKKSCLTVCLLASAAYATEFNDKWQGSFTVASKKGQLQVERTSKGIVLTEGGDKGEVRPTLLLSNAKGGDDIKLKSTLTPRSFEKALSQVGEVVRIFPPALDEYIQASKAVPSDIAQAQKECLVESLSRMYGDALNSEEIAKMWTSFMAMTAQEPVVQSLHVERVIVENTGESKDYNVTQETDWLKTLGQKLPNLDVDIFRRWYSSQNNGTSQGINDEALTRYIDLGLSLYRGDMSIVSGASTFQKFSPTEADLMKQRLQPCFTMQPLKEGEMDTLMLLGLTRNIAVFEVAKVLASETA